MLAVLKKEVWNFFGNWNAWIIIGAVSLTSALFLFFFDNSYNMLEIGTASLQSYFTLAPWILMLMIPALSMKSFAEEQQSGTLSWLFSQPLKISEMVVGKWTSVCLIALLCVVPSLLYFYTIFVLGVPEGNLDLGATLGSYFGLIILIAAFSAIGILASSMSSNQVIAYLLGVFMCFILFYGIEQLASYKLLGGADYILQNLGFYTHYLGFTRGLIDSRDFFYFLLVILVALWLSVYFVEKKKR